MKDYLKLFGSIFLVIILAIIFSSLMIHYNHSEERDVIIAVPSPSELLKEIEK